LYVTVWTFIELQELYIISFRLEFTSVYVTINVIKSLINADKFVATAHVVLCTCL